MLPCNCCLFLGYSHSDCSKMETCPLSSIYFMTKDVKNFFMYLLFVFLHLRTLLNSFARLLIRLHVLSGLNIFILLYILDINPLSEE